MKYLYLIIIIIFLSCNKNTNPNIEVDNNWNISALYKIWITNETGYELEIITGRNLYMLENIYFESNPLYLNISSVKKYGEKYIESKIFNGRIDSPNSYESFYIKLNFKKEDGEIKKSYIISGLPKDIASTNAQYFGIGYTYDSVDNLYYIKNDISNAYKAPLHYAGITCSSKLEIKNDNEINFTLLCIYLGIGKTNEVLYRVYN